MKVASETPVSIVSNRLQMIWILITVTILIIFFYKANTDNLIRDPYTPIYSLTPAQLAKFGGTPAEVKIGMYVRDVPKFDPVHSDFVLDVVIWFIFDPRLVSFDRLKNFYFEQGEVLYKSEPKISIKGDDLFVRFDMRLRFNATFDYREFPFDDHRLNLALVHDGFTPAEAWFDATRNNLEINPLMSILGWRCFDWRVSSGFTPQRFAAKMLRGTESFFPTIVFSFDFERVGIRHVISIFIPLLLILFIALFTFSIDPYGKNASNIVTLSATTVTALIAYRFVIETMSPGVGYLLMSDYVFLAFLIVACLIFFLNVFWATASRAHKTLVVALVHLGIITTFFLSV